MKEREDIFKYVKEKFPNAVLSGESSGHLEEILVDLFYNDFLVEDENMRLDL